MQLLEGSQLVVVGDPKQLPPTSFFDRVIDDDEEDPTAIEESESILDATLPMFPARRLQVALSLSAREPYSVLEPLILR